MSNEPECGMRGAISTMRPQRLISFGSFNTWTSWIIYKPSCIQNRSTRSSSVRYLKKLESIVINKWSNNLVLKYFLILKQWFCNLWTISNVNRSIIFLFMNYILRNKKFKRLGKYKSCFLQSTLGETNLRNWWKSYS